MAKKKAKTFNQAIHEREEKKSKAKETPIVHVSHHEKEEKPKTDLLSRPKRILKGFWRQLFKTQRGRTLLILFLCGWGFLVWLFWDLPFPTQLASSQVPVSTKLYDRNGELLYEIYADKKSTPVALTDIPDHVKNATIAIEDKDFYNHHGVDITGITRAAYKTLFKQKLEGGSTLTQQLVKTSLLTPDRTLKRKVRELALTIAVEIIYSKDKILELYLNEIPYGSTAYGIQAASELYFAKDVKDLNLAEASLLAGLTAAPSKYSPFGSNPQLAKDRQRIVLGRMVEDGYITQEEADDAKNQELTFSRRELLKAPHFSLYVKELLAEKYGESTVERGGLRVTTTLDLEVQQEAEKAVLDEVTKLERQNVGNGAALVTRPKTGEILAMVGSKDYNAQNEDGKVNIIFAQRQPGSSIKPLNFALAISEGKLTAATPLADVPTCFTQAGTAAYCPKNYDGSFHGATQVRFALGNSYNIPAVRTLALNGLENFINFSRDLGITTFNDPSRYGLSLTLGGGEVHPADMAVAYGVFANQGVRQPLIPILKVEDYKGKVLEEIDPEEIALSGDKVMDAETAFIISHILSDNNARIAAFGSSSFLNVRGHPEASVKTGTTNDRRDNWTIGYTEDIVVLSWVGNNDNAPMSGAVSGVSGASPIWNRIIKFALDKAEKGAYSEDDDGHGWPKQPATVKGANVCTTSGTLPGDANNPGCQTRFEYFKSGFVGAAIQSGQTDVKIDKTTGAVIYDEGSVPPENIETQSRSFILDPLGTMICTDCAIASQSATIRYPLQTQRNRPTQ